MAEHTKGPWVANYSPHQIAIFAPESSYQVTQIFLPAADYAREEANARLIAAAPDLLEALEAYVHYEHSPDFSKWSAVVKKAQAAIDKARSLDTEGQGK